ncbi:hypothetical protein GF378_02100 [Candidatus Pacearchaeota archaeon]|nr:hypothetical protein [Candidatus Pacearchaeota archaeon]
MKKAKISKILVAIILTLVVIALAFLVINNALTGRIIQNYSNSSQYPLDYRTYTKAVCDENNYCQDYEITCKNKQVINISPITGANIQHSENWEDPRPNKSEIICK